MSTWKLGCRWGSKSEGKPLFFDMLQEKKIVIGWENNDYGNNSIVLLTDGKTVIGIARTTGNRVPVFDHPEYEELFTSLQIDYCDKLFVYTADITVLKKEEQFVYDLVQGICQVQSPEIIVTANLLLANYQKKKNVTDILNLLHYKKQIILQGPPGTGKTYTAKDVAEQLIFGDVSADKKIQRSRLKDTEQFLLKQFHPSYSYEDFIRGISAKTNGGHIEYKVENKPFAAFAEKAMINKIDSEKDNQELGRETIFDRNFEIFKDELQNELDSTGPITLTPNVKLIRSDVDAFIFRGNEWEGRMLFTQLKKLYLNNITSREEVFNFPDVARTVFHRTAYYFPILNRYKARFPEMKNPGEEVVKVSLKNFVIVIDEINRANLPTVLGELIYGLEYRDEPLDPVYEMEDGNPLILPSNLFIIGTMNTADRSVGHIDYAIRRRFAFINVPPQELVEDAEIYFNTVGFNKVALLFNERNVSSEFEISDVKIGHSYFIAKKSEAKTNQERDEIFSLKMKYEIQPILTEYIKDGILIGNIVDQPIRDYINALI